MSRWALALALAGGCAGGARVCTLDGEQAVERCAVVRDAPGTSDLFAVVARRGTKNLELDTAHESRGAATLETTGYSFLEYTDASGATCDAINGSATWGAEGDEWCMRSYSTCDGVTWVRHEICMPLAQAQQ